VLLTGLICILSELFTYTDLKWDKFSFLAHSMGEGGGERVELVEKCRHRRRCMAFLSLLDFVLLALSRLSPASF
jgi:hypothetical protein